MSKFKNSPTGRRVASFASIGLALIAVAPQNVFASLIPITGNGDLVKNNSTALLSVSSNTPCIAFSGIAPACGGLATPFVVSGGDAIFSRTGGGTIKDIASTPIIAFETVQLTSGGPAIFDLLNIITPSGYASCSGPFLGACSTGTFVLSQISANQVQIGMALNERGYVGSSATGFTAYVGNFSTTLSGDLTAFGCTGSNCSDTIANILAWEAGAGHTITSSWAATQSPVSGVPEPATLSMMGVGLLGLGLIRRRKRN
jgi:hypothetical protein